ncbi:GntR family transcriptional regulator, partial [Lactiplantibacillus plantarum]|uniref:GntR family transcriptional regulator n=1 Tax=Lactiplantibacillus plantarum TaxID=1590 RepID=UPI003C24D0A9
FIASQSLIDDKAGNYTLVRGFTNEMKELGIRVESLNVKIRVTHADSSIASYLHTEPGTKIIELKRLRGTSGTPIGFFVTYFKFQPFFSTNAADYQGSFYEYLESLGYQIANEREVVEALLPTKELCQVFKIAQNTPVLRRSRFTSDSKKDFYEFTDCFYIATKYKYFIDFQK